MVLRKCKNQKIMSFIRLKLNQQLNTYTTLQCTTKYSIISYWIFWLLSKLKWKKFNYKVLNLIKHYNFSIECSQSEIVQKIQKKLNIKIYEFKTNMEDTK
jgi:hypothetical protein